MAIAGWLMPGLPCGYDVGSRLLSSTLVRVMELCDRRSRLIDLRDETHRDLDSWARVLVYAVMLYPRDQRARSGVLKAAKQDQLTEAAQAKELAKARTAARVGLAGSILLRLIQIEEAGEKPSLRAASFLISEMWEKDWLTNPDYSHLRRLNTGRQRQRHLDAWHINRPVAHLWAALLLPLFYDMESPTFLDQDADFIEFIHVAEWFAARGSQIYLLNPRARRNVKAMEPSKTWCFKLPERYRPQPGWAPNLPALTKRELRALTSVRIARRAII